MEEKEVVKKRNFSKILIILLILYIIGFNCYKVVVLPINNIIVKNNKYLSDQEIIDISGIRNYPSFMLTTKFEIKNKLKKNDLIKDIKVGKSIGRTITISVEENIPFFEYDGSVVLENGKMINANYTLPILSGNIDENMLKKLVEKYKNVDDEIKIMISEIKYDPNNIDKERFLFTMNDGNYVYITLYKIVSINEYIKILSTLEGLENKKGILYLDSGNYFEAFK